MPSHNRLRNDAGIMEHRCTIPICPVSSPPRSPKPLPERCSEPHHSTGAYTVHCSACPNSICSPCRTRSITLDVQQDIFQARHRLLCATCWDLDRSPAEKEASQYLRQVYSGQRVGVPSFASTVPGSDVREAVLFQFCHCRCAYATALCHACRTPFLRAARPQAPRCSISSCSVLLTANNYGGSRCRWCSLPCGPASRIERREIFREREEDLVDFMKAMRMDRHSPETTPGWWTQLDSIMGTSEQCDVHGTRAGRQLVFDEASDEKIVEAWFGKYNFLEAMIRDSFRARLYDQASPWRSGLGVRKRKGVKSMPLVREGAVPDSLALFQSLVVGEQVEKVYEGNRGVGSLGRSDENDKHTLYDSDSDAKTLKNGTESGERTIGEERIMDHGEDGEDARTVASMGSTLVERAESEQMVIQHVEWSSISRQHHQLVPTDAERKWALFCNNEV